VVDAVRDGRPLEAVCAELGRSRAESGVELTELLDDIEALFDALPQAAPSHLVVRAAALGWADATCALLSDSACEDPLSRLTTPAYLRTRLAELYREASRSGTVVSRTHALVVVRADPRTGLIRLTGGMRLAESLRAVFSGGETLCGIGPTHTVALVARDTALAGQVAALRRLLDELHRHTIRVWVESLPAGPSAAVRLLEEFAR
jgi:hypothetical protein